MKKQIKSVISLFSICAVIAIVLGITNAFTAPLIKKNEDAAANAALLEVLPSGEDFQKIDLTQHQNIPATVIEAYSEKNGGYVFKLETTGYSAGMIIMFGVAPDGSVSGAVCLSSGETLGYEKTFGDMLKGKTTKTLNEVNTISGATKTTAAYRSAAKDALNTFINMTGGSADIRTEKEILSDNLSAALPAANGEFSISYIDSFMAESGIDAVYVANNGSGKVYVVGESFIGVDTDEKIIQTDIEATVKALVESSISKAGVYSDVDITKYSGVSSIVKKIRKSDDGTLIFELHARGFSVKPDNEYVTGSGQPIVICLSMTNDGTISDCRTMANDESAGYGAPCGDASFYSQYDGKTQDSYTNVDAISGATVTTKAYRNAIKYAFEAAQIIKGGT